MTMCQVTSLASVFWPFVCPLVAAVAYPVIFLSMQQSVCAGYIGFVAGRRELGVHQARLAIDFYVALHAKVPLVAFLACAHLRGVLYNASSMARPERLKHCCRTWMRSMVSIANKGRPADLTGLWGPMRATNSRQGTTNPISSRNSRLHVRLVFISNPLPGSFASCGNLRMRACEGRRVLQSFLSSLDNSP